MTTKIKVKGYTKKDGTKVKAYYREKRKKKKRPTMVAGVRG